MPVRRRKIAKNPTAVQAPPLPTPVAIERQAYGGYGVGRCDGLVVFVPRTAPGDVVRVRLVAQRRHWAVGEVVELLTASPWRVTPPCPLYAECGGCHLQHLAYARQLEVKTALVRDSLARLGHLPEVPVAPTLPSPQPLAYRNKMVYHYDAARGALGLLDRHGQRILDVPRCLLSDPRAEAAMAEVRALAAALPPLRQVLQQVQVQVGQRTGDVLVTLVVSAPLPAATAAALWQALQPLASGLCLHHKRRQTPALFAGDTVVVGGRGVIYERFGEHLLPLTPHTFAQVNTAQTERLHQLLREAAALRGDEVVLDLYSGSGALAFALAPYCARLYGVEVQPAATRLAQQQAQALGFSHCTFRTGKVERLLRRYLAAGLRPDLAVLDPPRAGCRPEALEALTRLRVPRLLYVSCSPPTLARDLQRLHQLGYDITGVQPLDMFPQTYHVECVAVLTRRSA
ncbi:MAG: putative RNA methyltransferase [Candidatus Tectimicrobiota bacterium]|nr:MAG: putative RNA methyltransferase [Candidatus Tectomicrobia bacterium]